MIYAICRERTRRAILENIYRYHYTTFILRNINGDYVWRWHDNIISEDIFLKYLDIIAAYFEADYSNTIIHDDDYFSFSRQQVLDQYYRDVKNGIVKNVR